MVSEDALLNLHASVMPPAQRALLQRLGSLASERGFYLAGGTAIAVHLGHRRSVDLDWFTSNMMGDPLDLARDLRRAGIDLDVRGTELGTLHGVAENVSLSFLEYHYDALGSLQEWPEYGCQLAALEDLACMKLSAISARGAKRDFIDLYALGRETFTLSDMLAHYQRKFDIRDIGHLLASLTYFDDAEAETMPHMFWDVSWEEVKGTMEQRVRDFIRQRSLPAHRPVQ